MNDPLNISGVNLSTELRRKLSQCWPRKTAFDISADIANARKDGFCKWAQCFYFLNFNIRCGRAKSLGNGREMLVSEGALRQLAADV